MLLRRLKNRTIAKIITRFPSLSRLLMDPGRPGDEGGVPWTPPLKPLCESKVAVVTTAGVHHRDQPPFDMHDPEGDPSFREIDSTRPLSELMITHDYYDHRDADRDMNVVFPVERLREFAEEGLLGEAARIHYGVMGHILGRHVESLIKDTAPEVARRLLAQGVDAVLLTPG